MSTYTMTSTRVDVRRVVECFAADLSMLVNRTQAKNVDSKWSACVAHDIELMAMERCLAHVHIQLFDRMDNLKAAHKYTVREDGRFNENRPGDNDWPTTRDGILLVIVSYSDVERANSLKKSGKLHFKWKPSDVPTKYDDMEPVGEREYSSNAYSWKRNSFKER